MNLFCESGTRVSVPAGAGFGTIQPTVLVSRTSPSGARVLLQNLSCCVLDIGADQISFGLRVNGMFPVSGLMSIEGTMFNIRPSMVIQTEFSPGTFEIIARNKSGTTQAGALAATVATCQAAFEGEILADRTPPLRLPTGSFVSALKRAVGLSLLFATILPIYAWAQVPPAGCEVVLQSTTPIAATANKIRRTTCTGEGMGYTLPTGPNTQSCFRDAVTITTQCFAAPAAGLRWYLTSASFSNQVATAQGLDIVTGTGANCVTGLTALTHKVSFGLVIGNESLTFQGPVVGAVASAICVRPTAATIFGNTLTGYIGP